MASEVELKQLVDDAEFIENMNKAFAALRADYELTMDLEKSKIKELKDIHVDIKNQLMDLSTWSRKSSGTICGLRGTGKTHLMLLSRHIINTSLWEDGKDNNLCIYLNMKRLCLPEGFDKEMFNRVFSIFIYEELAAQLMIILNDFRDKSFFDRILKTFDKRNRELSKNLKEVIDKIMEMIIIAHSGNECLKLVGVSDVEQESSLKELEEIVAGINAAVSGSIPELSMSASGKVVRDIAEKYKESGKSLQYLNIKNVRSQLLEIIRILNLDSITFYVDEWEKISSKENCQEYSAEYIDQMIDDPIFFWISIVPYRGGLYCLDNGADLQHQLDLDENLIYENSNQDKAECLYYFKKIIDKRLNKYFPGKGYSYNLLFNNDNNLSLLVMASMGNTRDFGTMLLKCWEEYQAYRKAHLHPGRPYKYIAHPMIISAIKDNGDKKYSNIEDEADVVRVWNDIKDYCVEKESSHFAIEEKTENYNCLKSKEFSELIYHRLLHLRKMHVPAKDADLKNKLSIYAINYAATYNLHSQERKMTFIVDYKTIHDRVRRYIYNPKNIISTIRIDSGSEVPCISCKKTLNPSIMKHAWETNTCPYCGGNIYNSVK